MCFFLSRFLCFLRQPVVLVCFYNIFMKIVIAGSRTITDMKVLIKVLSLCGYKITEQDEIVSGGARGVDTLGEIYAKQAGIKVTIFKPDWDKYGKVAGLMRNKEMAKYASEHYGYGALIAFWDGKSRGTDNMINNAIASELKVFVYNYTEDRGYLVL